MVGRAHFPEWKVNRPHGHVRDDFTAELIDARIIPASEDAMGAIIAAEVTFMAKMRWVDVNSEYTLKEEIAHNLTRGIKHQGQVIGHGAYDSLGEIVSNGFWMMQVQAQRADDPDREWHPTALLLQKSESFPAQYRRVGCANLDRGHEGFFNGCKLEGITLV